MNIVFADFNAGFGGHSRTAVTIAEEFCRRGHQVRFLTGPIGKGGVIDDRGFQRITVRLSLTGRFVGVRQALESSFPVDVVHIFSESGVEETVAACKALGLPVFRTICGGPPPRSVLPMGAIISLSEEVKAGLALEPGFVTVLRGRIATSELRQTFKLDDRLPYEELRSKYNIDPEAPIVLRVARLGPAYEKSVVQTARAVERLSARGKKVTFLYIGYPTLLPSEERLRRIFAEINENIGRPVAVWARDESREAVRYTPMADVVVGTGRAAFEAMLAERPVIVVGNRGFAGVVDEDSIDDIAWYNFSGRNQRHNLSEEESVDLISKAIEELLDDDQRRVALGEFSRSYVERYLDVRTTVDALEELYGRFDPAFYASDKDLARALNPVSVRHIALRYLSREQIFRLQSLVRTVRRFSGRSARSRFE